MTISVPLKLTQDFDQWVKGLKVDALMSISTYSSLLQTQVEDSGFILCYRQKERWNARLD